MGYADTQQGAVQAATNFSDVLNSAEFVLHPDAYRAAIRTMAAPSWNVDTETRLAQFAPEITAAAQGKTVIERAFYLSYHVDSFTESAARITVLGGGLTAIDGQGTGAAVDLGGDTFSLTWLGDWRVADEGVAFQPGLQLANPPPQTNQIPAGLKQSTGEYGYAAHP